MSNFGYTDLRLVNPYDVAFREAKSAVKAGYILEQAQVFDTVAAAVADCAVVAGSTSAENRDLHLPLHRLEAAGEIVRAAIGAAEQKAGLLFGSEKFGLSNEDMSYCQWLFRIPTRSEHGSMNLGQAVAVTLYELRRKGETATQRFEEMPRASGAEFERIVSSLHRLLSDCGYVEERQTEGAEIRLRLLVQRLGINAGDARTWQGILRQIQWKVDQGKG